MFKFACGRRKRSSEERGKLGVAVISLLWVLGAGGIPGSFHCEGVQVLSGYLVPA